MLKSLKRRKMKKKTKAKKFLWKTENPVKKMEVLIKHSVVMNENNHIYTTFI